MKLQPEEIKQAVTDGKITAISLDTSIFDRQGRRLETGLLKRMRQFRDTKVAVVISDIVVRELRKHLIVDAHKAHVALKRALKDMEDNAQLTAATSAQALATVLGPNTPESIADSRWDSFARKTQTLTIDAASYAPMVEVMNRYFESRPPFRDQDNKRNEFPDAYALLSLETWAAERDTWVLAVSGDGDWEAYCSESPRLVLLGDLGAALGCFQDEAAEYFCRELGVTLRKGDRFKITDTIKEAIQEQESQIEISLETDSQFSVDEEEAQHEIEFKEIQATKFQPAFEPVEFDGKTLIARAQVDVTVKVTGYFSFTKRDPIDRDYIPMGSGKAMTDEDITLEILLTFAGDIEHAPVIENIEVLPQTLHVSFTDLEPDWMQDPGNFDSDGRG